jgi:diketogulonate reductase-like aldo/keto reductase
VIDPAIPARTLATGDRMPLLGLGVWQIRAGRPTEDAVTWALEAGYRHVDTARLYGNEGSVGRAIAASGVPREEIFVTTKLLPRTLDARRALNEGLDALGTGYVDLFLIHWHSPLADEQWLALEEAHRDGLARAIGVSNFGAEQLRHTASLGDVVPHVDQVEFSPWSYRAGLVRACEELGCVPEAYSPLTRGRRLGDPVLATVAAAHGRTPAQVLLRWCVQRGIVVIPKSARRERIAENARIFDFELAAEEMAALDALDTTAGTDRAR